MKLVKWKKYRGFRIRGDVPMEEPYRTHLDRAAWLTAQVESGGKYGAVISYDGTGMTAGVHQAIAVYPRELKNEDWNAADDQGPLWKLLKRIEAVYPEAYVFGRITRMGWYIANDGTLRHSDSGKLVRGLDIRKELNGAASGVTPVRGGGRMRATAWAEAFSDCFSQPITYPVQDDFGKEHFVKRATRTRLRFTQKYKKVTIQDAVYGERHISCATLADLSPELDLAMSLFWSNSVNAPGFALKMICKVARFSPELGGKSTRTFAKRLIHVLGTAKYGRWSDDIKGGRYQRSRDAAMKIWPKYLFEGKEAIMPARLPD